MNFRKRLFLKLLFTFTAALTITAAPRPKAVIKTVAAKVFRQSPSLSMTRASGEEPRTLLANKAFTVMGYNNGGFVIVSNDDLLPAVFEYSFRQKHKQCWFQMVSLSCRRSYQWYCKSRQTTHYDSSRSK